MKFLVFVLATLIFSNSPGKDKGHLVIIGGGKRPIYVMEKIIELAGHGKILVIPNASSEPLETATEQVSQLSKLGADADFIMFDKINADSDSILNKTQNVTGIFFSGGDQSELTADLLGTKLLDRIKEIYKNGGVISGTSAGAAVMSEIMITGNELIDKDTINSFTSILEKNIEVKQGFGFLNTAIIDQHFVKRKRHNRLISIILENPKLLGIAIDEATSIIVYPDNSFEVLGESQVLVLDAANASTIKTDKNGNLSASELKMHLLVNGDKFSIPKRKVVR